MIKQKDILKYKWQAKSYHPSNECIFDSEIGTDTFQNLSPSKKWKENRAAETYYAEWAISLCSLK